MDILDFWGKAQPLDPDQEPKWHPLVFHSLDVAAVGAVLLARHCTLADHLSVLLGLCRKDTIRLLPFLLGLHDIGKFAKRFQAKVPCRYPRCFGDDVSQVPTSYDHGAGGLRLFDADAALFALPGKSKPQIWLPLVSAVTGHHGAPPMSASYETIGTLRPHFGKSGIEAAREFVRQTRQVLDPPIELDPLNRKKVRRASFALAGLCVLADWIGSRQEWFGYCAPRDFQSLESYWISAMQKADRAVVAAGVLPAGVRGQLEDDALIGTGNVPTPMQTWARSVELPAGPALFMIEDETGSGKTEAALMLAHRLMAERRADGLYIALPTMATANAMFDRLGAVCRILFAPDTDPSVALAHSARDMHPGFRSAPLVNGKTEQPYSYVDAEDVDAETTATTACVEWIADDRRRTFLADAGAGTVDQALLSVLPNRYQSLRLLGLMRRVLILDEVHAYDAYMQREIDALLEFQAGLGGSAIILSATLPEAVRQRLAQAFACGLDKPETAAVVVVGASDYPRATVCAAELHRSEYIRARSDRGRSLPVRFLRDGEEALREVGRAADAGGAVAYIRNTVDDALDAYKALAERDPAPVLFHARFALVDRLSREREVLGWFGKMSRREERDGRVLVATQVVEQSLDLDFDAMVTDLAPVDLVIQRAGRLWRHEHREREGCPELLVVGPSPNRDADEEWFSQAFPRAAYVYRNHACLWLTANALREAGVIDSRHGLRALIEEVYGDGAEERVPEGLLDAYCEAEGRANAERSAAGLNVLGLAKGYVRDAGAWDVDARTQTRLSDDPHVTLRLARVRDGRVVPYGLDAAPDEPWRAWRLSEVSVSVRRVAGEAIRPHLDEAAHAARAEWGRFDREKLLIVLEDSEKRCGSLRGSALAGDGGRVELSYDSRLGLTWD